jgi:hypothetical protein
MRHSRRLLFAAAAASLGCALASGRISKDDLRAFKFTRSSKCPDPMATSHWSIDGEGNADFTTSASWFGENGTTGSKKISDDQLRRLVDVVRRANLASVRNLNPGAKCVDCCLANVDIETSVAGQPQSLTFEGYLQLDKAWANLNEKIDEIADMSNF